jgi:hypothetical protein
MYENILEDHNLGYSEGIHVLKVITSNIFIKRQPAVSQRSS